MRRAAGFLASLLCCVVAVVAQSGVVGNGGVAGNAGLFGSHSAVVFDAASSGGAASGTSVSFNHVVGSGANRAIIIGCSWSSKAITGEAVTVGGTNAPAISGTKITNASNNGMTEMFALAAPTSGTQSVAVSWTNAAVSVCGAVSATGVDQATPANNGTGGSSAANASPSVSITSSLYDLPIAVVNIESGAAATGASAAEKWNIRQSFTVGGAGEIGTTTGTQTLSWSIASSAYEISGANFKHQ